MIRYDYLWREEAAEGAVEGRKERPCAIVIAHTDTNGVPRALLVPITHSQPEKGNGILLPPKVKRYLGLDDLPSWIITNEVNDVEWSDPGIVPISKKKWAYGFLPPQLMQTVLDDLRSHQAKRGLAFVARKNV